MGTHGNGDKKSTVSRKTVKTKPIMVLLKNYFIHFDKTLKQNKVLHILSVIEVPANLNLETCLTKPKLLTKTLFP